MKPLLLPLFLLLLASLLPAQEGLPAGVADTPQSLQKHLRKLTPKLVAATVAISPKDSPGSGSGVIIDASGLVLTAAHVIMKPGMRFNVLLADGRTVDGVSLGLNTDTDAGMLRIETPGPFPFRPAITEKTYEIGDLVIATGQPGGPFLGRPPVVRLGRINRDGIASGMEDPIQSTCTVISGDSGGPLYDLLGRVIGIHSNIGMPWSANHHVPLPCFRKEWQDMLDSKEGSVTDRPNLVDDPFKSTRQNALELLAEHPDETQASALSQPRLRPPHVYADIVDRHAEEAPKNQRPHLGLRLDLRQTACVVSQIAAGSPAAKAGLQVGDRITACGESSTPTVYDFSQQLHRAEPGTLLLGVERGTNSLTLSVETGQRPRRRLLQHPYAGLLQSMLSDGPATPLGSKLIKAQKAFLSGEADHEAHQIEVLDKGERIAFATFVSTNGYMVTKHSVIKNGSPSATARPCMSCKPTKSVLSAPPATTWKSIPPMTNCSIARPSPPSNAASCPSVFSGSAVRCW